MSPSQVESRKERVVVVKVFGSLEVGCCSDVKGKEEAVEAEKEDEEGKLVEVNGETEEEEEGKLVEVNGETEGKEDAPKPPVPNDPPPNGSEIMSLSCLASTSVVVWKVVGKSVAGELNDGGDQLGVFSSSDVTSSFPKTKVGVPNGDGLSDMEGDVVRRRLGLVFRGLYLFCSSSVCVFRSVLRGAEGWGEGG